ncbi:hypothetical protein ACOSP7_007336 [Xanthoceras sorbifolium]
MTSFAGTLSPVVVEAKAIMFGLLISFEGGFFKLTLNSNSLSVVNNISGRNLLCSELGLMVEDIHQLVSNFQGEIVFSFAPRSTNRVAHYLSKLALENLCYCFWVDDAHSSVRNLLLEDSSHLLYC